MGRIKPFAVGLCLLGAAGLRAAALDYPCYRLSRPPLLDGRIEPEVWAAIPEAVGVYHLKPGERMAARPTRFRVGWTPETLYLAIRCAEPEMGTLRATGGEGDPLWTEDSIELCFMLPGTRLQYIVSASGVRWQAKWLVVFGKDMGAWQARAWQGKDEWTLEIAIPFSDFRKTPSDQERWSFGLARNIPRPPAAGAKGTTDFCALGDVDGLVFWNQEIKGEEAVEIGNGLAASGEAVEAVFAAQMQAGADRYKAGDFIAARRDYAAASALAAGESEQAQALLQLGHCLYALSARVPAEGATRPNRAYAQSLYEQVVDMAGALPETRAQAQVYVAYCLVNVGECNDLPGVKAACAKALTMSGLDRNGKIEMLRILCDTEMAVRDFGAARARCLQMQEIINADKPKAGAPGEGHWLAPVPGGMDLRLSLLENWERMRKTPAETFSRHYEREAPSTKAVEVLPSIRWTKPGQGEPLRVLVMCYLDGIREVAELAQRMEIAPAIVTTAGRQHFYFEGCGENYPAYYAPVTLGVNQYGGISTRNVRETFERALDLATDVMILAGINWSGMPSSVREKILAKVAAGTPLILKVDAPDELLRAAMAHRVPIGAAWAYPYKGLPAFAQYAAQEAWLEGAVARYRHGKGDLWALSGYDVPDYQILTPGPTGARGSAIKLVEYDYYLALIIHLLREAAGVKTPVRVQGNGHWELAGEIPEPLTFQLVSDTETSVTCVWTVRDRDNRISAAKEELLALKAGVNDVNYAMGAVSGGEYFVDLQVKIGTTILDFGSALVRRRSTDRTESMRDRKTSSRLDDVAEADRHAVWPQGAGAGSYLAEYLRAGHERAGVGKVLNNFVTELLDVSEVPGQEVTSFTFENPRAGWVLLRGEVEPLGPSDHLWVWVGSPQDSRTMLDWAGGEKTDKQKEIMRYLEPGRYRAFVGVQGKARLRHLLVRAVPEIVYFPYPNSIAKDLARASIDWEFLKKHILGNVNVVMGVSMGRGGDAPSVTEALGWKARGGSWFSQATVPYWHPSSETPAVDEVVRYWTSGDLEMGYVDGLACDEFTIAHLPKQQQKFEVYCQALQRIKESPLYRGKRVDPYFGLGHACFFRSAFRQIAEIGYKMQLERYLAEAPTQAEAARAIAQAYDLDMEPFLEVAAQPQQHILHVFCPVNTHTYMDTNPSVDFKVFLDMQFNYLANAPACAGLYGLAPWHCSGSDEETIRWLGQLYRHYCIEGRRDLLSRDPYELNHIRNGDFTEGLKEWSAIPAEDDSLKALTVPGFSQVQWRGKGDECVSMRRSAKGPNRLGQTIRNLERGRFYSVGFYSYNPKQDDPDALHAVSVEIERGDVLRPLCSQAVIEKLNWHFVVFRAQADAATLSISDWRTPSDPGAAAGQELLYDFIQVQPYLAEQDKAIKP